LAWRRLGLVFAPDGRTRDPALATHAALPVPFTLEGDLVRVFYSGRDTANRSALGSVMLRLGEAPRVEEADPAPILRPGALGAFDDAGIGVGNVVADPGGDRPHYMGWNVDGAVPWRNAIGLALGDARAPRFARFSAGPVMDRDPSDPFSQSYPWVLRRAAGDWRMWYGTHRSWGAAKSDMSHAIRGARSTNGIAKCRSAGLAIPPDGEAIATVRPSVIAREGGGFAMWFARRTEAGLYALGLAHSADGRHWRREPAGLEPMTEGWDGGAITYPSVFEQHGRRWLLYNGAGYGATGFGLAVWEDA